MIARPGNPQRMKGDSARERGANKEDFRSNKYDPKKDFTRQQSE